MRNAAIAGNAARIGMPLAPAYKTPAQANAVQPIPKAARNTPGELCIGLILASMVLNSLVLISLFSAGLSFAQTLGSVVLPQAIRLTIPPLTNRTIAITKGTALGSVIGLSEILSQASSGVSFSFNPSPLTLGAVAYLILFLPVVVVGRWVETRFAWKR